MEKKWLRSCRRFRRFGDQPLESIKTILNILTSIIKYLPLAAYSAVKSFFRGVPRCQSLLHGAAQLLFKSNHAKLKISIIYVLLFTFTFLSAAVAQLPTSNTTYSTTAKISTNPQSLVEQGKAFYDAGNFTEAAVSLQQAADAFKTQGDYRRQAMSLSNLSLAYQQLGKWTEAEQAITESLQLLENSTTSADWKLQGAALDIQGQLHLAQGKPVLAGESWKEAASSYTKAGDEQGVLRSQINQTQAQQVSGMYRSALKTLQQVNTTLQQQPNSQLKATALRSLGNTQRLVGNIKQSREVLLQSLAVAEAVQSPQDISATLLSLGNTARTQGDNSAALDYYHRAANAASNIPTTKIKAQLNQLSLLLETSPGSTDQQLVSQITAQLAQLPPSRTSVEARINLAHSLMQWQSETKEHLPEIVEQLRTAIQQARSINDPRAESQALGQLGTLYEQNQQLSTAQELTEQALLLVESIHAPEIAYVWQWQLGRLLKAQGETTGAIAAYTTAVKTLQSLRSDLANINPDVQFSFRESVEPVYRELVGLLLQAPDTQTSQSNLIQARQVLESLQQAELVNFFREDCLNSTAIQIDDVDKRAAILYPIVLKDRLEVVLSLPDAPLRHYATPLPQVEVEAYFQQLRQAIAPESVEPTRGGNSFITLVQRARGTYPEQEEDYLTFAQQVYDWLIRPAEAELISSGVKTLVFLLDVPLLNLPMAVLHDGEQFLIEKYALAITPGLQLLDPKPLARGKLTALKAGITKARDVFPPLPFVQRELQEISDVIPGELLLNQEFTSSAIEREIDSAPFPVVHLATHGQFSSNAQNTFILAWDERLDVNQLNNLLRSRAESGEGAIELLVLSACQTATGDKRAALGLAGVAVRAGARSTLATLWLVDDRATAELMIRFYQQLADTTVTKAEALRRAQISLLRDTAYDLPRFWAPFILVGNWL
ncbi:CHAT domain-containing protein [Lyngbya aestuarii]|uniref:CHAT domain-containing protein n=1 Tax=Lyngbya aestuarii TaxID=118322 RepID=UPI00403D9BD5